MRARTSRNNDERIAANVAPTVGLAPISYNLGVAVGWKRLAVSSDIARIDLAGMPGSRDLSGGLTVDKLLGGWTVTSGPTQCRLNLTYTAKEGTAHYRASAPGCQIGTLANTAAWALQGSQVQLFDESGSLIAALVLSGNQFIGTVAGGTAITMAG